jgi:4-cresol dehydrogenase (hydroxylating)
MEMPKKLPPGVSAAAFAAAIREFQAAVGKDWVFTSDEDIDTYRDAYSLRWGDPDEYIAAAAVAPDNVEEVQKIVRIANRYKIPLYPISTGKNLTYGGPAPSLSGSVVLDLKRMNRVIKVDDKRNFALVEPGVSYFDLYRYIQDKGLKVWIDTPDPGWGSPVGNALDHGVGYTASPFRDHFGSHCGMEVVTPTGDIMRTGMGALPEADSWQDYRYGVGPYIDGLFSQANFGIVTKMGFWLYPQPEAYGVATVTAPNYKDFGALIETVSYLEDSHLMTGQSSYVSPLVGGGPGAPDPEFQALMANGWPSDEQIDAFAKKKGGQAWRVRLQFYGPEVTIRANASYAAERFARAVPGSVFTLEEVLKLPLTPEQVKTHHKVSLGIPNMEIFQMIARKPTDPPDPPQGHVDLLAVCPRTAEGVHKANRVIYETQRQLGEPTTGSPFGGPITWHHRGFLIGAPTTANYRDEPEKNKHGRLLYSTMLKNLAAAGFGLYRTNVSMHELLVEQYSFGDHALKRFWEALKDGIDPNGIVSPGRYGIWPKRLRKTAAAAKTRAKAGKAKA